MNENENSNRYDEDVPLTFIEGRLDSASQGQEGSSSKKNMSFKYTGKRSLAMRGLVSGKKYYFNKPGKVIEIDHRDLVFFEGVPNLEKLDSSMS